MNELTQQAESTRHGGVLNHAGVVVGYQDRLLGTAYYALSKPYPPGTKVKAGKSLLNYAEANKPGELVIPDMYVFVLKPVSYAAVKAFVAAAGDGHRPLAKGHWHEIAGD